MKDFTIGKDVRNGIENIILFDQPIDEKLVYAIYPLGWEEYNGFAARDRFKIQKISKEVINLLVAQILLYRKLLSHVSSSYKEFPDNIYDHLEDETMVRYIENMNLNYKGE